LNDGLHRVALTVIRNRIAVIDEPDALIFHVNDDSVDERGGWYGKWPGAIRPRLTWQTNLPVAEKVSN
jgi:lipopolysaccharide transport system ATP-binding protein